MIAILAGSGQLPADVYRSLFQKDLPFVIVVCDVDAPVFAGVPVLFHHTQWGKVGALLDFLHKYNVTKIMLAGAVTRPQNVSDLKFDWRGLLWINSLKNVWNKGDDGLLRGVIGLLEKEGFAVVSPQEFLPPTPVLHTLVKPEKHDFTSIQTGINLLKVLSSFDVGQSVVVSQERIIGIEGPEGTDALMQRCAPFIGDQRAILVKMAKVGQSLKVDQPTLGPQTILQLRQGGLKGVAFEQHTINVIDPIDVLQVANKHHIFIYQF